MKSIRVLFFLSVALLFTLACGMSFSTPQTVVGSGVASSQERSLAEFTAIEVAGSADVFVTVGEAQRVVVETDDNILPLVETSVQAGRLVISMKPFTSISPRLPVRVTVTVPSIEAASISGSGSITLTGVNAESLTLNLPGSGDITVSGATRQATISLRGSGNIQCGGLEAQTVDVSLDGSGDVTVNASQHLGVTIRGSGSIHYRGNPAEVNQSVSGSGSVDPIP
jgi:Putative auto-transporter adhesin, head GIN domain